MQKQTKNTHKKTDLDVDLTPYKKLTHNGSKNKKKIKSY